MSSGSGCGTRRRGYGGGGGGAPRGGGRPRGVSGAHRGGAPRKRGGGAAGHGGGGPAGGGLSGAGRNDTNLTATDALGGVPRCWHGMDDAERGALLATGMSHNQISAKHAVRRETIRRWVQKRGGER